MMPARSTVSRRTLLRLLATAGVVGIAGRSAHAQPIAGAQAAVGPVRPALQPPVAARKPTRSVHHGIEITDDYAWLKAPNWREAVQDPTKLAPEIRSYISDENAYAEAVLEPLKPLRATVLAELKGRVEQTESGTPTPDGPYAYWSRYQEGQEHVQIVRTPRAGGDVEILVDVPALAAGKPYYSVGAFEHSPDHRHIAYLVDESGAESFDLHLRDLTTATPLPYVIPGATDFTWAGDSRTLVYVRRDSEHRPRLIYRHALGSDPKSDVLIYEEKDAAFEPTVYRTGSKRFLVIHCGNNDSSEAWLTDGATASAPLRVVVPRRPGMRYAVNDWGDDFVIRTNIDGAADFKLISVSPLDPSTAQWRDLIPPRAGVQVDAFTLTARHLVRLEIEDGLQRIVIRNKASGEEHTVTFPEEAYAVGLSGGYEFDTDTVRLTYSSPTTPQQTFSYDLVTRERVLLKQQKVPSGHDPSLYVTRRFSVPANDGEMIPVTVLHRKDLALDGRAPVFISGYGAYSDYYATGFNENAFSLVDRGFVYATAHVRGGIEKGDRWREAGRLANKMNTFTDFIAIVEALIAQRYTAAGRIVARGDSAGGLLVGAVANMRPDLFGGIVARVPFVDALNTMLDPDLPLTASDVPEWGDPLSDPAAFRTILSYSPYDNVKPQAYPAMLVTAGLSDPRVTYWEPAKWVAKLRATKTDTNTIALVTQMTAGHGGVSGRFASLDEVALVYAFALEATR